MAFLMYAAHSRVKGIRTQFETLETVKVERAGDGEMTGRRKRGKVEEKRRRD